jgi:hypothetical protein
LEKAVCPGMMISGSSGIRTLSRFIAWSTKSGRSLRKGQAHGNMLASTEGCAVITVEAARASCSGSGRPKRGVSNKQLRKRTPKKLQLDQDSRGCLLDLCVDSWARAERETVQCDDTRRERIRSFTDLTRRDMTGP